MKNNLFLIRSNEKFGTMSKSVWYILNDRLKWKNNYSFLSSSLLHKIVVFYFFLIIIVFELLFFYFIFSHMLGKCNEYEFIFFKMKITYPGSPYRGIGMILSLYCIVISSSWVWYEEIHINRTTQSRSISRSKIPLHR